MTVELKLFYTSWGECVNVLYLLQKSLPYIHFILSLLSSIPNADTCLWGLSLSPINTSSQIGHL